MLQLELRGFVDRNGVPQLELQDLPAKGPIDPRPTVPSLRSGQTIVGMPVAIIRIR